MLRITFIIFFCAILSCCAIQAYTPGQLGSIQPALIKGFSTDCYGKLKVVKFDEKFEGFRLEALPGNHSMRLAYRGRPQMRNDLPGRAFPICVVYSEHTASFATKPGHTYWFNVDEISDNQHKVSVWESIEQDGVEGVEVIAQIQQLKIWRSCSLLSTTFSHCPQL